MEPPTDSARPTRSEMLTAEYTETLARSVPTLTPGRQAALLAAFMAEHGITQAELARRIGRTPKHVNQVFTGKAGTGELDYWAFVLGLRFDVRLVPMDVPDEPTD